MQKTSDDETSGDFRIMQTMKEISIACDKWLAARGLEKLTLREVINRETCAGLKAFRKFQREERLQTLEGME